MNISHPDQLVTHDDWSDLSKIRPMPDIDFSRLHDYRIRRIRKELKKADAALCMLVSPVSLRYAVNYRCYGLFQAHVPTSYVFVPLEGPVCLYNAYDPNSMADEIRTGRAISFFDGGFHLNDNADKLSTDVVNYLSELGTDNRRVAIEYVNPSITQALEKKGLEVIDGVCISEHAKVIKSADEIECMRWAVQVAELGIGKLKQAIRPGVSEVQLWGLLNYANLANDGDWHDGRMLASGPRINPWLQEASMRKIESGDLVGFDTDMIGPFGYFADISRTMHCGPDKPTKRQKQLYRIAYDEVHHNLGLVKPGLKFSEFQYQSYRTDEIYHENVYPCILHAVGMTDEYPRINPVFKGANPYDGEFEAGMVLCIESYIGAVGERDGVKLEQQVLVTDNGYELLTTYPFEEELLE